MKHILSSVEYLAQNPDATLTQYNEYCEDVKNYNKIFEAERQQNEKKYYDSLIGKYFKINHNDRSFLYFKLGRGEYKRFSSDGLAINLVYTSRNTIEKIEVENREIINELWMPNPYRIGYYSTDTNGCKSVEEITQQQYENLLNTFNRMSEQIYRIS